ncbi:cysteine-rich CWC family protein [Thalassotalea fonticola]|uniref:Cysteine-rich CWC family protein n=1 Tax=Thalassotalea fonticola TaxID=3065649 RepID=A0ABZ0GP04_9GAMM|nr:cysteine-rich CWC family protein [Colwelliaceae bacterium S1-1]
MNQEEYVSPEDCPLCGENNHCGNLSSGKNNKCWCANNDITFPESLLSKVSNVAKNKSCICKACALKHKQDINKST